MQTEWVQITPLRPCSLLHGEEGDVGARPSLETRGIRAHPESSARDGLNVSYKCTLII